jgi:hypothetical protein
VGLPGQCPVQGAAATAQVTGRKYQLCRWSLPSRTSWAINYDLGQCHRVLSRPIALLRLTLLFIRVEADRRRRGWKPADVDAELRCQPFPGFSACSCAAAIDSDLAELRFKSGARSPAAERHCSELSATVEHPERFNGLGAIPAHARPCPRC